MEIKKYLFKNQNNNQKENINNKVFKRNQKNNIKRDSIFNHKLESSNSQFTQQNIYKNNIFLNTKTNSSNNIINTSSIFNSYHKSQSTDKKSLNKKKSNRALNSRNLSQANKISLNNKKKFLTSTNNTITSSLTNNQLINYNKCITDRYYEENKIKYININKLGNNKIIGKSKTLLNKDFKDTNYLSITASIPKKSFVGIKKDKINTSNNFNIGKNIIKSKLSNKEAKYQLNYNDNNKTNNNIMNENILFKKKISNYKNANSNIKKSNKNKMKNQNMNNLINKKKINNLLNIKKLNLSNLPINFFEGKIMQGIMSLNTNNINNTNIINHTDSTSKKECYTDRTNYNYLNNINSQIKTKEIINEQYNNINNNYIIANIINNIKYNNNKPEKKKISRNKSIKLSEGKNTVNNTNLTSLNILLKNSTLRNYPSSLRIKTIDLSRMNNKTPTIEYNLSFNKKNILESKNMNKRLFDANNNLNVNFNKKNISTKRKNNCNIKFKKKGKNYKKLINVPLKLTKKNIFHKENKLNIDMHYSNNTACSDKLNLLTFNYIHSLNTNHKTEYSNKRKLSQGNNSDRYKNVFQLINTKNSINDSKRNSHCMNKIDSMSKTNLIHNIPRQSFTKQSKYINSLSNYEISSREKEKEKNKNSNNTKTENLKNMNNTKLRETVSNQKLNTKKPHSNSPLDMNCLIKKKYSKKNKNSNHSKSRNINRIYKNYVGFLNNESKTNISKYNTNKSSQNKKETNELNNHLDIKIYNNNKINSKKRMKNLSVALDNHINKSIKTDFDIAIKENEKQIKYSFKDIFSKNKSNTNSKNIKNEENVMNTENEYKLISVKKNSKNSKNQIIQKANSIKSKNQSEFSKKSKNINNSMNGKKNKAKIKEDNQNKENDKDKDRQVLIIEEYFDEILYSLLKEESEFISNKMIDYNYLLNTESEITPEMRAMVVDWLLEVHQIFHFQEKCLFTTIQLMDKFLSKKLISIDQFQLLALTSLNIASKQEEVEYPILDNFITISKNTVTKQEMIDMENDLISTIKFDILSPTVLDFFQIYASICNLNPVEVSQGLYIMNILLIDINMLKYKNSILAFAVLKLITKEENINKVILFIEDINKKAYKINGNKNNEAHILVEEINKENNSNEIGVEIKYLFRTILKTHYHNAKNKFNNQIFHAVSSYTSI